MRGTDSQKELDKSVLLVWWDDETENIKILLIVAVYAVKKYYGTQTLDTAFPWGRLNKTYEKHDKNKVEKTCHLWIFFFI